MNKAEQQLVAALRGGSFIQCAHTLATSDGRRCVMGVSISTLTSSTLNAKGRSTWARSWNVATRKLGWAHRSGILTFCDRNGGELCITDLNDYGLTFSQLADIIAADLVEHLVPTATISEPVTTQKEVEVA